MASMSRLLSLPREIRNMIWRYAAPKPYNYVYLWEDHIDIKDDTFATQPAILQVNKQIREEALPFYYSESVFKAVVKSAEDLKTARQWLVTIGHNNVKNLGWLSLHGNGFIDWPEDSLGVIAYVLWRFNVKTMEQAYDQRGLGGCAECTGPWEDYPAMCDFYKDLVSRLKAEGKGFDMESMLQVMDRFQNLCVDDEPERRQCDICRGYHLLELQSSDESS